MVYCRRKIKTNSKIYKKNKKIKKTKKHYGGQNDILDIKYNDIKVNGQQLTKEQTKLIPSIKVLVTGKTLLIMLDPDAPIGTFVHLVQVYNNGQLQSTLVPYHPPTPPSGIHRYITTLYELPKDIIIPKGQSGHDYFIQIESILKKLKMITSKQFQVPA